MPSKKKRYNARFPPARIKKIMQKDEEVGKVAQAVPVIIAKALESFAEQLLTTSSEVTRSRNARTLTPHHIKTAIFNKAEFQFLRELAQTIPDVNNPVDEDVQQLQTNIVNAIVFENNGNNNNMVNCVYSSNNTNNDNIDNSSTNNNNPMLVASTSNRGRKPSPTATMTTSSFSSQQPSTSQHHQTSNNIIHENNVPIRTRGRPRKRPLIEEPCLSSISSSTSNTLKAAVDLSTLQSGSKTLEPPNKNSRVQTDNNFNDDCRTKTNQQQAKQRGKRPKRRKNSNDDEDSAADDDADELDDNNNEDNEDDEDTVEDEEEEDDDATEDEEYEEEIMDQWIKNETSGGDVLSSSSSSSINSTNKNAFNLTKCSSFTRMTTTTNQMAANFGAPLTTEQTIVNKEDDYDDY